MKKLTKNGKIDMRGTTPRKLYDYKGEKKSVREIAELEGMSESLLRSRIARGMGMERAISKEPIIPKHMRLFTVDGVTRTVRQWADYMGVPIWTVQSRLYRGIKMEDILKAKIRCKPHRLFTWKGKTLRIGQWARLLGINQTTISNRIKMGLPLDKVFLVSRVNGVNKKPLRCFQRLEAAKAQADTSNK